MSPHVISGFQSNSEVLLLINCGNKSKSFLFFYLFYSMHTTRKSTSSLYNFQPNLCYPQVFFVPFFNSFPNSFTSFAAVTTLLSSLVNILFIMSSVHVGIKLYITPPPLPVQDQDRTYHPPSGKDQDGICCHQYVYSMYTPL